MSKRTLRIISLKNPTVMQIWRLTKGIGLVIKLVEQDVGCTIVVAGWIIVQAQISEVTKTKTVRVNKERTTISSNRDVTSPSKRLLVTRNSSFKLKLKPTPGLIMCAKTKIKKV